jgi:DNA-binding HxlR family transcriptional regulator
VADGPRRYEQFCGVALALDVVGERWTMLVVRELLLGGRRFKDLGDALPGLTPTLLTRRLRRLQAEGLVVQRELPAPSGATVYELTEAGRALEPAILALGAFGQRYLDRGPPAGFRVDLRWAVLSLQRRWRGGGGGRLHLSIGERPFTLELGERLVARDGHLGAARCRVSGPEAAWRAWFGARDRSGLEVLGDGAALDALEAGLARGAQPG